MRSYGIIGYPLDHSFSQPYFTEKFRQPGLEDYLYLNFPISDIGLLKELITNQPDLLGLNITSPYKRQVMPFLTDRTNIPTGLNACNCIRIIGGRIIGFNTDITGFENSLLKEWKNDRVKALVLGNGGASEAVKFVLKKLQIGYEIAGRKISDDCRLTYTMLDEAIISSHLLIINTTPVGTYPRIKEYPGIPYQFLTKDHLLYDLVYNPVKTLFLQKGERQGAAIQNGYDMLILQAEESWKIWNSD